MEIAKDSPAGDEEALTDYADDGVDLTLIRWFLSMTPKERLHFHQRQVNRILTIRELNGSG
jgi:hypothetical protein